MQLLRLLPFLLWPAFVMGQQDSMRIHFLYGSKPAKKHRHTESHWFGGLHGGHVSIEYRGQVIGFIPSGTLHLFPRRQKFHSAYVAESLVVWQLDTPTLQYKTVVVPLTPRQAIQLDSIHRNWLSQAPFDYAFFGMRCAAGTYEILGVLGLFPERSRFRNVLTHFYPKPLRRKVHRWAVQHNYPVHFRKGRVSRKWERG